jgi:hypothetical protein
MALRFTLPFAMLVGAARSLEIASRGTSLSNITLLSITPLGGPSVTDTSSCGSSSGSFPTLAPGYATQLGCTGAFKSQTVAFS